MLRSAPRKVRVEGDVGVEDEFLGEILGELNHWGELVAQSGEEEAVEGYLAVCHKAANFLRDKDEGYFLAWMNAGVVEKVCAFIERPVNDRVRVGSLEMLGGLLACPTSAVTQFLLNDKELPECLVELLKVDDKQVVQLVLRCIGMMSKDFVELGIRCFSVFHIERDALEKLMSSCRRGGRTEETLMMACRYMCESQKFGQIAVDLLNYIISTYDACMHPELLFPLLVHFLRRYPNVVCEYTDFKEFMTVRLPDFLAPREVTRVKKGKKVVIPLDRKQADAVATMAIKTFFCYCKAFPCEVGAMCQMIPIDNLLMQIDLSRNSKFLARAIELLTLRLKQENSEWVCKSLFDHCVAQKLSRYFELGRFRLKKATMLLATAILKRVSDPESIQLLVSPDFVAYCCDFLQEDNPEGSLLTIKFLSLVCDRVVGGNVEGLQHALEEANIRTTLESFSSLDPMLSSAAHVLFLSLDKLFC